ncbi:hypothetical protein OAP59_01260 [Flavobacteriales bacterium]|nr:hypothetical protein [Flavobacteriales bacterium]
MKPLLTAIACFFALSMSAQTWNPDADFDNVIGVNDLMELLSVFGTEWTAEYPQDLEYELAAYYNGTSDFVDCKVSCSSNGARILSANEYAFFQDSVLAIVAEGEKLWVHNPFSQGGFGSACKFVFDQGVRMRFYNNSASTYVDVATFTINHCFCTGLVPVVE